MTRLEEFDFHLPESLIAQEPVDPRDHCRLMVIDRGSGRLSHYRFDHVFDLLRPGDCLVLNDTRVIPARFRVVRAGTGGSVEILFLEKDVRYWHCLLNPSRSMKIGLQLVLPEHPDIGWRIVARRDSIWLLEPDFPGHLESEVFSRYGKTPTPPYIRRLDIPLEDYQTVYAKHDGSVAAPTAGLHFTKPLLDRIGKKGITVLSVTLRVGPGTFQPVKSPVVEEHHMHSEWYQITQETAQGISRARERNGRIVAVGTTVIRVLETVHRRYGFLQADQGSTDLFITPGFSFNVVDALITNFHLPRSTLFMLVNAFCGIELARKAYQEAIEQQYRFYSFGDACLIW